MSRKKRIHADLEKICFDQSMLKCNYKNQISDFQGKKFKFSV